MLAQKLAMCLPMNSEYVTDLEDVDPTIEIHRAELLEVVRDLDMIVVSLERMRGHRSRLDTATYARIAAEFLDQWDVARRLDKARLVLARHISKNSDEQNMDELAHELIDVSYWSPPDGPAHS